MYIPSVPLRLAAATVATILGAAAASAACSDRPGTPIDARARLTSTLPPMTIEVSWTNTARNDETVFWDVEHTVGVVVFPNPAGIGRGDRGKGLRVSSTYTVDVPKGADVRHCFKIKARTERGTNGCLSDKWSNLACAIVPAAAPKPVKNIGKAKFPAISVRWLKGDVFLVKGTNFTPNAPVTIDVSGEPTTLKSITVDARGGSPIVAKADGSLYAWLGGVCNSGRQGTVAFVARDKDRAPTARVTAACHSGAEYVPNRKIKP